MKQFLALYDSEFDSQAQAQTYADEASAHAKKRGLDLASGVVDTRSESADKKYWTPPNTIECVTVNNNTKVESTLNPSALSDIDAMVDRLCTP
jgi:hypothetical protein